jgi:hypothetical protein
MLGLRSKVQERRARFEQLADIIVKGAKNDGEECSCAE